MRIEKRGLTKGNLKKSPDSPGVYIFWNKERNPIYVGKAKNLKRRLDSYASNNLTPKTAQMMSESKFFSTVKVNSELEALLLEAQLVKLFYPKYNSQLKDDKHPLYIRITKEKYPRVLTARKLDEKGNSAFFGPFPSSSNVKNVLKVLRRIFPYAQHTPGKRACLYSQIGLCNPCPSEIENLKDEHLRLQLRKDYRKNINNIRLVLFGRIKSVRLRLEGEMQIFAKKEKFEEALGLRDQIAKLDYITAPVMSPAYFLRNPNLVDDIRNEELKALRSLLIKYLELPQKLSRIECFDVAHLAGSAQTASMVTFVEAEPEKTLYRHFKIRQGKLASDIASLKEVAQRREKYLSSWGVPDLIIVDGGRTQVEVFLEVFKKHNIAVVGLAKRFEKIIVPTERNFVELKASSTSLALLQRIRNEAHRFAQRYHHKLLEKELFGKK